MACPTTIYGKNAGYPAFAMISDHLITVRTGEPPGAATPAYAGSKHLFTLGSDITLGLVNPQS
jgi:hypothetical protein